MAKDAKGHGSNSHGGTTMTSAMAMGVGMDAGNKSMRAAGRTAWNEDDVAAASGVLSQARGLISNDAAAAELSSGGPKSDAVPVHASMTDQQARYASIPGTKEGERSSFSVSASNDAFARGFLDGTQRQKSRKSYP